jgi:hypothetical protein
MMSMSTSRAHASGDGAHHRLMIFVMVMVVDEMFVGCDTAIV